MKKGKSKSETTKKSPSKKESPKKKTSNMSLSSEPTKKKAKKDWEFYVSQGPFLVQNAVCFCSLPFVALFTCHFENKMIIQPDVNHHWVNDSTLTKLHNAADPNGKKVIDVSFSADLCAIPYEISTKPNSFQMLDCRTSSKTKYYAHRLTRKVFLKTIRIFQLLIPHDTWYVLTEEPDDNDDDNQDDIKYASIYLVQKFFATLSDVFNTKDSYFQAMSKLYPGMCDATVAMYFRKLLSDMNDITLMHMMWIDGQHRSVFSTAILGYYRLFHTNERNNVEDNELWNFCSNEKDRFLKVGCSPPLHLVNFNMKTWDSRARNYAKDLSMEFVNQTEVADGRSWNDLYNDCLGETRQTKKQSAFFISKQETFQNNLYARGDTDERIELLATIIKKMSTKYPGVDALTKHQNDCPSKEVTHENISKEIGGLMKKNRAFYFGDNEKDQIKRHTTPMFLRAAAYWLMTVIHDEDSLKDISQFLIQPSFEYEAMTGKQIINFYHPGWIHDNILYRAHKIAKDHYKQLYIRCPENKKKEGGRRMRYFTSAMVVSLTNLLTTYGPNPIFDDTNGQYENQALRQYHLYGDTDCIFSTFTLFLTYYIEELREQNRISPEMPDIASRGKYTFSEMGRNFPSGNIDP